MILNERNTHGRRGQPGPTDPNSVTAPDPAPQLGFDPVLQFLRTVLSNTRSAVITRRPGEGWRSEPAAWGLEKVTAAVYDPSRIVGIRPEGRIRLVVVDIDRKPDRVSPYWHPYGESRPLQALEAEAAAAGCGCSLVRSSTSGGLHALITLPEPVKAWQAHWVGAELVARAGMELAAGSCELFPSRLDYSSSTNPEDWAQSHGVRLPGQEGSALLVGTTTATDTGLVYEQLLADLEGTDAGPAWAELQQAARTRQKAGQQASRADHRPRHPRTASRRSHQVRWSAAGQTNENLARITSWARAAHPEATSVEALAPIIEAAASSAPGFREHASDLSQRDLQAWCRRWAACSLRRDRSPRAKEVSTDKHHNRRLFLQTRAALTKLWQRLGDGARSYSQRIVADLAHINRKTLRRHWDYWLQLLGGPHPCITGGAAPAVDLPESNQSAVSVSPAAHAEAPTPAATVETTPKPLDLSNFWPRLLKKRPAPPSAPPAAPVLPLRDDPPPDPWRERQRAELAAWLGLAS